MRVCGRSEANAQKPWPVTDFPKTSTVENLIENDSIVTSYEMYSLFNHTQ